MIYVYAVLYAHGKELQDSVNTQSKVLIKSINNRVVMSF